MRESSAYLGFKNRMQDIFNFAVLVTASVPSLKQNLKLFEEGTIYRLPDPDYFGPSVMYDITPDMLDRLEKEGLSSENLAKLKSISSKSYNDKEYKEIIIAKIGEDTYKKHRNTLKKQSTQYLANISGCTDGYKTKLATYLYFSAFSFFEFYITDIAKEIADGLPRLNVENYLTAHQNNHDNQQDRIKLDHPFDPRRKDRYKKLTRELKGRGFETPSDILAHSLLELLNSHTDDLKANNIPDFLSKIFLYSFSEADLQTFHNIRANRNSIGHGDHSYQPSLSDVISMNRFLRKLSANIDEHIVFHFKMPKNFSA